MLGISKDSYTDLSTQETVDTVYLRLYLSAFKSGLVAELSASNFKVLMTICSFMDEDGKCFPTQEQIAERSGCSKPTVNKAIKELLEFTFNGKPILKRSIIQKGYYKNSVYTVSPVSQVAIFDGQIEILPEEEKPLKKETESSVEVSRNKALPKAMIDYFFALYNETYGVRPSINYGMVTKLIKTKWLDNYSEEQMKTMIKVGVREFDKRWKTPKFQRPTLPAIISWIGEQALGLEVSAEKEFKENIELTAEGTQRNTTSLNRLANRLTK